MPLLLLAPASRSLSKQLFGYDSYVELLVMGNSEHLEALVRKTAYEMTQKTSAKMWREITDMRCLCPNSN